MRHDFLLGAPEIRYAWNENNGWLKLHDAHVYAYAVHLHKARMKELEQEQRHEKERFNEYWSSFRSQMNCELELWIEARKEKNWPKADEIRERMLARGARPVNDNGICRWTLCQPKLPT